MSGRSLSAFPYVGGKSELASWIISHLPDHRCYVEPFAGSASVLLNKPRSKVEVLNDLDGDVVQFFDTVRERGDELREYIRFIPYSRELYDRWADEFYDGYRPDDPIERAGRFVYLRYSSFGGKYGRKTGFKRASHLNQQPPGKTWTNVPNRVDAICDRLRGVEIECLDALEIIDRYDGPNTVFYCDPPYLECRSDYYAETDIDHAALESALRTGEGEAIVSYGAVPDAYGDGWFVRDRDYTQRARRGATGEWKEDAVERLCLTFDPDATPSFVDVSHRQETLAIANGGAPSDD